MIALFLVGFAVGAITMLGIVGELTFGRSRRYHRRNRKF